MLVTKFLVYLDSSMSFTFCVIFLFSHKERDNENFREDWVAAWSGGRGSGMNTNKFNEKVKT